MYTYILYFKIIIIRNNVMRICNYAQMGYAI